MEIPKNLKRYRLPVGTGMSVELIPDKDGDLCFVKDLKPASSKKSGNSNKKNEKK